MKGIIAAGSPQTAAAGAQILRAGGSAVDAAAAAVFASFVAEAAISTLGGGGFALLAGPGRAPALYDFFCAAPGLGRSSPPESLDFAALTLVFEDASSVYHAGRGSSAVPGNLAGLAHLLDSAGTLPLRDVLAPAIRLARHGFTLDRSRAYLFRVVGPILEYTPGSRAIFAPDGRLLAEGDHFAMPAFAEALEHIAAAGPQTLYSGELAAALLEEQARGGLITAEDLAAYRTAEREPLHFTYHGHHIYTNPPPSAGGILIAYALRLLERADLGTMPRGSAEHIALLAEVMRQAGAARRTHQPEALPDPAAWTAWLDGPHLTAAWEAVQRAITNGPPAPIPDLPGGPKSTTHVSVIDETGLAVGITTTPGETGGYTLGETGVLMNNILGEANLNPQGFHQWPPGIRLPSMMAPTLVMDGSAPRLVVGSGGSNRLRSAILQFLSNVLDWQMPLDEAVSRARVHFEDGLLDLEAGFDPAAADALEARGYDVLRWGEQSLYFGGAHAAARAESGRLHAAGDSRRGGAVVVVE